MKVKVLQVWQLVVRYHHDTIRLAVQHEDLQTLVCRKSNNFDFHQAMSSDFDLVVHMVRLFVRPDQVVRHV